MRYENNPKEEGYHACICGQWVAEDHTECLAMKLDGDDEQDEREFESE
jgi:hypothetical protein